MRFLIVIYLLFCSVAGADVGVVLIPTYDEATSTLSLPYVKYLDQAGGRHYFENVQAEIKPEHIKILGGRDLWCGFSPDSDLCMEIRRIESSRHDLLQ